MGQPHTAHLLDQAPGRVEVNVAVGQQLGAGRGQVLDVLPCGGGPKMPNSQELPPSDKLLL